MRNRVGLVLLSAVVYAGMVAGPVAVAEESPTVSQTSAASAASWTQPSASCARAKRKFATARAQAAKVRKTERNAARKALQRSGHRPADQRRFRAAVQDAQQAYAASLKRARGVRQAAC